MISTLFAYDAAILCSTFGAISANVLAGSRVFFAMARDGAFFRRLATCRGRIVCVLRQHADGVGAQLADGPGAAARRAGLSVVEAWR